MIKYSDTFPVGPYAVNCSIVHTEKDDVFVIDPGAEPETILACLGDAKLRPTAILLTHGHFDHIGAVNALQAAFPGLPVYVGEKDVPVLTHPMNQCPPDYPPIRKPSDIRIADSGNGPAGIEVISTPGHTPGGVCYRFKEDARLYSGDTLFAGSVGRTDFPGGDMATLMRSLERLKDLPDDTTVIPGHGPETTISDEKLGNPFLQ